MPFRTFEDKIAFVTGATSGIGRGVALAFAREGATVIGCGRNITRGAETQRLVEAEGGTFLFLPMDLGDETQVTGGVRTALDRYGRLDCAANCAGVDRSAGFLDYTAADFDCIFDANVRGLFLCLHEEVLAMRSGGGGAIVNVGSVAGQRPFRGNSLYNASRSAVTMLTRSVAAECAEWGIRINEVSPGPVLTPMLTGHLESTAQTDAPMTAESLAAGLPLGGILSPQGIADSVLFLCSLQASKITGATLVADGGFVLG
ncbi:SDR family NAD(P)-dependent oxidoreductase [Synechococcus sp. CS-1328]|uniref:SDR family NAD(P)-dependent oxidoreductase n=1 Tax=Synechococcus sp. CS-1328 TaxID=2847976 RepID=UPI00223B9B14|nr:SDR family oxidoreductase [Synechococcus sp. CS-1328]MCT0223563.1 SDR family oxidoreductase [Synechococcus sp. CS-1328]